MKNLKNILLASMLSFSLILVSVDSRASENLEIIIVENSQLMKMEVKSPSMEEIDVFLYNQNDRQIFSDKIGLGETFETQFDFSELRNGTYKLVSEVGNMRVNRVIQVSDNKVELVDDYYSFIPVFTQKEDKLIVHYVNNGAEDIGVSIESNLSNYYDAYYDNAGLIFSRIYSLKNFEPGTYSILLTSKGDFHSYEFRVD
ncbi:MAG: hypothetical protein ACP5E3_11125 [Bacteroidales bacterium]